MIKMTFNYLALIAGDASGVRIAFPWQNHALQIFVNGAEITAGRDIVFEVKEGRATRTLEGPSLPIGGRVFSIADVAGGGPYSLLPTGTLLAGGGPAQAVVSLHGGAFAWHDPVRAGSHADSVWEFGTEAAPKPWHLTDTVTWETEVDRRFTYSLVIDGVGTPLAEGDEVLFSNNDRTMPYFTPDKYGRVRLSDVGHLYDLVTPSPTHRPIPHTVYVGPWPPYQEGGPPPMIPGFGPDFPLCPVGEG